MRDAAASGQSWVKMAKDIGDILKGETAEKPEAKAEPEKVEIPEPEKSETPEATVEADIPASEPEEQPKPDKTPSRELGGLKAAVTAERNKRQAAEKQIEDLLAKHQQDIDARERRFLQTMQQFAPKPPEQPVPGIFDDPAAWEQRQQHSVESRFRQSEIKMSERLARMQHGDDVYSAAEKALESAHRSNPNDPIFVAIRQSDDPAGDMVRWHQERTKLNDFSDPKTALTRLLSEATPELKAEILATLGGKSAEAEPSKPAPTAFPTNLAGARSISGNKGKVFSGAPALADILNSRKK
jgi:hypothetical protein